MATTQLHPSALPGRGYGSFSGRTPLVPPVEAVTPYGIWRRKPRKRHTEWQPPALRVEADEVALAMFDEYWKSILPAVRTSMSGQFVGESHGRNGS
jgi:hypothetical protein